MTQANYMQILKQSHEEKMAMFMKCTKKKLAEMLITCNDLLDKKLLNVQYIEDRSAEITFNDGLDD